VSSASIFKSIDRRPAFRLEKMTFNRKEHILWKGHILACWSLTEEIGAILGCRLELEGTVN